MSAEIKLISTETNQKYPFNRIEEFSENNESLEVKIPKIEDAKIMEGSNIWQRFKEFFPFSKIDESILLGEGNTPLLSGDWKLKQFLDLPNLLIKNETLNPTLSFKDRGSVACIAMAKEMNESVTATISTGNMGSSIAAYGAKAGIKVIIFIPEYTPKEKINAMSIHGAEIIKVVNSNYSNMKKTVLQLASELNLRVVSGNGPIRTEGYKTTAFELYEQMHGQVPDYIAVPTSACGHIRGIFKGYKELYKAGYIKKLPKMIVVQASNNSPLVSAIQKNQDQLVPFLNVKTIAKAITTGNPIGGNEIIKKAHHYKWLAEKVTEEEILESQKLLALSGYFVEPSSATVLHAIKKLRDKRKINKDSSVVMILTGSGLKDTSSLHKHSININEVKMYNLKSIINKLTQTK